MFNKLITFILTSAIFLTIAALSVALFVAGENHKFKMWEKEREIKRLQQDNLLLKRAAEIFEKYSEIKDTTGCAEFLLLSVMQYMNNPMFVGTSLGIAKDGIRTAEGIVLGTSAATPEERVSAKWILKDLLAWKEVLTKNY
jgi:hypothetical protein